VFYDAIMADVYHRILGVRVDDLPNEELESRILRFLETEGAKIIVTPNPEFVLAAKADKEFLSVLSRADLSLPDGVGLKFAVAALYDGAFLKYRHTGGEALGLLAKHAALLHKRLLILGGSGKDPLVVAEVLKHRYPGLDVVAFDPGIVDDEHPRLSEAVMARLKQIDAHIIAVALGQGRGKSQGKQEKIMESLRSALPSAQILIGIGGVVRVLANPHLQAPALWRRFGFEWAWRSIQQPWRLRRIFRALILFPLEIIWATLKQRRFFKACKNVLQELKHHFGRGRA
jgi:N-acetylglucosaminyldiphosphoundecaprenol N-acetyl-beta-D-mannosaminyltransferase